MKIRNFSVINIVAAEGSVMTIMPSVLPMLTVLKEIVAVIVYSNNNISDCSPVDKALGFQTTCLKFNARVEPDM